MISDLFQFKTISDEKHNEYVLFSNNCLDHVSNVEDRTSFEAIENHIHLIDNIKKREFEHLSLIANNLGKALLCNLKCSYPDKRFIVYVSISLGDSMIIRFHQKWLDEVNYYTNLNLYKNNERIYMFEN